MDTPFHSLRRARKVYMVSCLFGLIWFGKLGQTQAQVQLPVPSPSKERQESKVEGKNGSPKVDRLKEDLKEAEGKKGDDKKDEEKKDTAKPTVTVMAPWTGVKTLTIGECIKAARERSPILKGLRIRVESAVVGQEGIERTSRIIHNLISPDLQYRRVQAENGIIAAQKELMQAEHDVTFNVVRTYYSAVYAKEQWRLTTDLEKKFKEYLAFVKDAVAEGSIRDLGKTQEEVFVQYVARAVDKRIQAEFGYRRALEGLRHEMSVGEDLTFAPADDVLPDVNAEVDADYAVAIALCKRGEVALAQIGVEVMELEVLAQGSVRFRLRQSTAAAASDIHSKVVPSGSRDGEYRPDAIAPDFPTLIVGDRKIRAERASALLRGQGALVEKTRDLVKLETMNAVIRFQEAKKRVPEWKVAAEAGASSVERTRNDPNIKPTKTEILVNEGLAAESRGFYNESRYQLLLALATLERATAGGIRVDYPGR